MRELELELESCKVEVKRERTRVLEREEIIVAQQREVQHAKNKTRSGSATEGSRKEIEQIYKQVLAEKEGDHFNFHTALPPLILPQLWSL